MKGKSSIVTILVLLFVLFSLQTVTAESKQSLVSLGDSITFGWNLSDKNNHPSKDAYPALVASEENYRIRNLSVGGDTSSDLLALLNTEKVQEAVRHTDLITLNIGSNDFLQGAEPIMAKLISNPGYQPTPEDMALLGSITLKMGGNLQAIIQKIRSISDAPIVLYTIYNPFYGLDLQAGAMLFQANQFIKSYDNDPSIVVVDTFSAFAGKQNTLIFPGDVHPNLQGQELIAKLTLDAIATLK